MDSLHYVMKYIKDAWRRRMVVNALFLDISISQFSIVLNWLIHDKGCTSTVHQLDCTKNKWIAYNPQI